MRIHVISLAGTLSASLLLLSSQAQAVPTLEYDFRVDENASYALPGLNPGGTLGGTASVTTGTAIGVSTNPKYGVTSKLENGFMTIADRGSSSATGDFMSTAAQYTQIFNAGSNNFGSGTFVTVIRPNFANPAQRQWFMTHTQAGGAKNIATLAEGALRTVGGRSTENAFSLNNPAVDITPLQNGDWYMIATSWQQSSGSDATMPTSFGDQGLPDGKLRSYVRRLTDGGVITPDSTGYYASDDAVRLWHTRFASDTLNSTLTLGNRLGFGGGQLSEGGTGDYALFQFYNTTFEQNDFDALFSTFIAPIPEPSSFTLSLLGCLALIRSSRRKRRLAQS